MPAEGRGQKAEVKPGFQPQLGNCTIKRKRRTGTATVDGVPLCPLPLAVILGSYVGPDQQRVCFSGRVRGSCSSLPVHDPQPGGLRPERSIHAGRDAAFTSAFCPLPFAVRSLVSQRINRIRGSRAPSLDIAHLPCHHAYLLPRLPWIDAAENVFSGTDARAADDPSSRPRQVTPFDAPSDKGF